MRLTSSSIHSHNPKVTLILIVTGIYNAISFSYSIKKVSTTFQVWKQTLSFMGYSVAGFYYGGNLRLPVPTINVA